MLSFYSTQEPFVGLDCNTTNLEEMFDSLGDQVMSKGDNLRVNSIDNTYSFTIDKQYVIDTYPDSMLSTLLESRGEWMDKSDITLPFESDVIMSFEKYIKKINKTVDEDFVIAVPVLHYLNIPSLVNRDICDYVNLPINNQYLSYSRSNLIIIKSSVDDYYFDIEKSFVYKKYPESILSGPWLDRDNIILPFGKELLDSLEMYLHTGTWIVGRKLRSGNDLYDAQDVLTYLNITFNENIEYLEDIKNPYVSTSDDLENQQLEDDFLPWEGDDSDDDSDDDFVFERRQAY